MANKAFLNIKSDFYPFGEDLTNQEGILIYRARS
jgi:hypothetical protein